MHHMTSLARLVHEAGDILIATAPYDPARLVTGVHVSELGDPGRYLDGGELLLTTGIPLTGRAEDADYVARLASHGVAAIGLGLGEGWDEPPPGLVERCSAAGVALFVVPDGKPFLAVSRVFWQMASSEDRAAAVRTANSHTELARAASGDDPVREIIRIVAERVGGWAAWVSFDGGAEGILHPPSLSALLPSVKEDVEHSIRQSGAAAASFVAHGSVAVAYAVEAQTGTIGALAVGVGRPLARTDRPLALTAVALLGLVLARPAQTDVGAGRWVTVLALEGDAAAARALARAARIDLPPLVRVLATAAGVGPDADRLVADRGGVRLTIVADDRFVDDTSISSTSSGSASAGGEYGALSAPVPLEDVPAAAARALALRERAAPWELLTEGDMRGDGWADALATARAGLIETVRAYLQHGQRLEHAARALNVHRNTVRERLAAAERVAGISLSDPDVTAELWLALRARPGLVHR